MNKPSHEYCKECSDWNGSIGNCMEICSIPMNIIEEWEKYHAIGTPEKIKEELDYLRNDNECQGLYFTLEERQDLARQHRELEHYRALESRLSDMFSGELTLSKCVDELELVLKEPDKPHPINAKILTYEDADKWESYKSIGTPEECLVAVEKQKVKKTDIPTL